MARTLLQRKAIALAMITIPFGAVPDAHLHQEILIKPSIESVSLVSLSEPIVFSLQENLLPEVALSYEEKITFSPETSFSAKWNEEHTQLSLVPDTLWHPNTHHTITFPEMHTTESLTFAHSTFSFHTPPLPSVESSSASAETAIPFNDRNAFSVTFDQSFADISVDFVFNPSFAFAVSHDEAKKTFTLTPSEALAPDTNYSLYAFVKDTESRTYHTLPPMSFRTLPETPESWPENLSERLLLSQKHIQPKIMEGKYIDVNLDAQITTLFDDGQIVATYPSSSGKQHTPTPKGQFSIQNKHPHALSQMFGLYLPYWLAFTPDGKYGFHDLPTWPQGHPDVPTGGRESLASIGVPNSPGCVRHNSENSKQLYEWADIGTHVVIY